VTDDALKYFHRVQDYRTVFGSPEGQRVLADMRKAYDATFNPNPYESSFRQGMRQVVRDITRLIELANDPEFREETVSDFFGNTAEDYTEENTHG